MIKKNHVLKLTDENRAQISICKPQQKTKTKNISQAQERQRFWLTVLNGAADADPLDELLFYKISTTQNNQLCIPGTIKLFFSARLANKCQHVDDHVSVKMPQLPLEIIVFALIVVFSQYEQTLMLYRISKSSIE